MIGRYGKRLYLHGLYLLRQDVYICKYTYFIGLNVSFRIDIYCINYYFGKNTFEFVIGYPLQFLWVGMMITTRCTTCSSRYLIIIKKTGNMCIFQ